MSIRNDFESLVDAYCSSLEDDSDRELMKFAEAVTLLGLSYSSSIEGDDDYNDPEILKSIVSIDWTCK